jgi:hypothetical protein
MGNRIKSFLVVQERMSKNPVSETESFPTFYIDDNKLYTTVTVKLRDIAREVDCKRMMM